MAALSRAKAYLSETTIHGLRYLVEGANWAEKVVWLVATVIAFTFASVWIERSYRDTKRNPISTAVEFVPVTELPFPALSIQSGYADRLLENLLNSFVFDCIGEDNGEKCSQDSTPVRDALESPLLEHINLTFEAVQQKWSGYDGVQEGENQTSLEQLICETIYENLGRKHWSTVLDLASALEGSGQTLLAKSDLADLTASSLRLPPGEVASLINAHVEQISGGQEYNSTEFDDCELVYDYSLETKMSVLAFLQPLGSLRITQNMGDILKQRWTGAGQFFIDVKTMPDAAFLCAVPDKLVKGSGLENAYEVLDYLAREPPTDFFLDLFGGTVPDMALVNGYSICVDEVQNQQEPTQYCIGDMKALAERKEPLCPTGRQDRSSGCCLLENLIRDNYGTILRIMKYGMQATSSGITEKGELSDLDVFTSAATTLKRRPDEALYNTEPAVVACRYGVEVALSKDCRLFSRTFTTAGLAYTFNSAPFFEVYQASNGHVQRFFSEIHELANASFANVVRKVEYSGPAFALEVYVRHSLNGFAFSLHSPMEIGDLRSQAQKVEPGMTYSVKVTLTEVVTDQEALDSLDPNRRDCQSGEERGSDIFAKYTQMKAAAKECGCIPWDLPQMPPHRPCHDGGAKCFDAALTKATNCFEDCPRDCSFVNYEYSVIPEKTDYGNLCKDVNVQFSIGIPWYNASDQNDIFGLRWRAREQCQELLQKEITIIKVYASSRLATRITRSSRISFSGQLGNLGGLLGLFTGISILSMFEVIFWIARIFGDSLSFGPWKRRRVG